MTQHGRAARFCIKRKVYRGHEGWLVYTIPHKCDRPLCFEWMKTQRFFSRDRGEAIRMRDEQDGEE